MQKKDRQIARILSNTKNKEKDLARHFSQNESSSEDEFEKQMNAELTQNVRSLEEFRGLLSQNVILLLCNH